MLKRALSAAAISIALVSCATNEVKLTEAEIAQYRGPASPLGEMEQKFQGLMQNSSNSAKAKVSLLDRFLKIQYMTEGEVSHFEGELDQAIARRKSDPNYSYTLQSSATYSKMMQLRYLLDQEAQGITHIYARLYETATDVQLPGALRQKAVQVINGFHARLKSLGGADRLQTLELIDELKAIGKQYKGASLPKVANGRMPASKDVSWNEVEKSFALVEKDVSKYRAKYKKETERLIEQAVASNEIRLKAPQEPVPQSDRAPSSERYAPGVGTYGNVSGYSFPQGLFVLTYDDGPGTTTTSAILDLLKANQMPASFFWLTKMILTNPGNVEKAKSLNLPINSHSWTHPDLAKQNSATRDKEINQAVQVAKEKIGLQPALGTKNFRFFRCPYGSCYAPKVPDVRLRIANLNLIHAYWAIDSLDWHYPKDPERVFGLVTKGMLATGRGVILMHDIHAGTVEVTRKLMTWIKAQNQSSNKIRFATLEAAVDEFNNTVQP